MIESNAIKLGERRGEVKQTNGQRGEDGQNAEMERKGEAARAI